MAEKIILIGAGGHAKVVMDCLDHPAYGFVDYEVEEFFGLKKLAEITGDYSGLISFGAVEPQELERRHRVFLNYKSQQIKFITAIHKTAIIAQDAVIGEGNMIGAGVIINSGVVIGSNLIINSGAIIEHDVVIGDGSHVAPGAIILGTAKIGKTTMIGAGAVILPEAVVPDNSLIKALERFPR